MSRDHLLWMQRTCKIPTAHVNYLRKLAQKEFEPAVIYDIGSAVLHWTREASSIWPNAEIVLFDAYEPYEFMYNNYKHHIGVLTDQDEKKLSFYQSDIHPAGNSYYKENNDNVFPESSGSEKIGMTLDTIVERNGFPLPDLVKIDVQGAEKDLFLGAQKTLAKTKFLILEAQHEDYNRGAPKAQELIPFVESFGWTCIAPKFSINGPDADYCFLRN